MVEDEIDEGAFYLYVYSRLKCNIVSCLFLHDGFRDELTPVCASCVDKQAEMKGPNPTRIIQNHGRRLYGSWPVSRYLDKSLIYWLVAICQYNDLQENITGSKNTQEL